MSGFRPSFKAEYRQVMNQMTFDGSNLVMQAPIDMNDNAVLGAESLGQVTLTALDFVNPNNADWAVGELAPLTVDDIINDGTVHVRTFDDSTNEGVGIERLYVPTSATTLTLDFHGRAGTSVDGKGVSFDWYVRTISDGAAMGDWSAAKKINEIPISGTDEFYNTDSEAFTLAALGLTAGTVVEVEISRDTADADDDLVGDYLLHSITATWG